MRWKMMKCTRFHLFCVVVFFLVFFGELSFMKCLDKEWPCYSEKKIDVKESTSKRIENVKESTPIKDEKPVDEVNPVEKPKTKVEEKIKEESIPRKDLGPSFFVDSPQVCYQAVAGENARNAKLQDQEVNSFPSTPLNAQTGVYKRTTRTKLNKTIVLEEIDEELKEMIKKYLEKVWDTFLPLSPEYRNPCKVTPGSKTYCLPKFYLLSGPKCGSTDFWYSLERHPLVFTSEKEPNWWARRTKTEGAVQKYISYYEDLTNCIIKGNDPNVRNYITGDGSTTSMWLIKDISEWLKKNGGTQRRQLFTLADVVRVLTPEAKMIFLLRNPIDRLYSEYWFTRSSKSAEDFDLQITKFITLYRRCLEHNSERKCVYSYNEGGIGGSAMIGLYIVYVRDWLVRFPSEQVLILRSEDWFAGQKPDMLLKAYHFLDIDVTKEQMTNSLRVKSLLRRSRIIENPKAKARFDDTEKEPMLERTRKFLEEFYEPSNKALAELTGDKGFLWKG